MRIASRTTDRGKVLLTRFDLAKAAVKEGRLEGSIRAFKGLAQEDTRREAGASHVLQRSDLNSIYFDSTRWSQTNKS